jgi:DNA-binding response OmpR family regulator
VNQILLVANRKTTIDSLQEILQQRNYALSVARTHQMALRAARLHAPDLIIVDCTSRLNGAKLCQELQRALDALLIAIVREEDEAAELESTTCLVKPYTARQLVESIEAALAYPHRLEIGPLRLDLRARTILAPHHTEPQTLSPKLFALLRILMQAQGEVVPRERLMAEVWETDFLEDTRTLDVHIRWLRQIIEPAPGKPHYLLTVRGVGYRVSPGPAAEAAANE